jgi:hypothetical protein
VDVEGLLSVAGVAINSLLAPFGPQFVNKTPGNGQDDKPNTTQNIGLTSPDS